MERIKRNYALWIMVILLGSIILNIIVFSAGYKFEPVSYALFTIILCTVIGATLVGCVKFYKKASLASQLCGAFMPIVTAFYWISINTCMGISSRYQLIFLLVEMVLGMSFFCAHTKNELLRTIVFVLVGSFTGMACFVLTLIGAASSFGAVYNSEEVFSPDEKYVAFVKIHDEGALGGSTEVMVRECGKDVFLGLGALKRKGYRLEFGNWGNEYQLSWKDEKTLQINGKEHYIPEYISSLETE